MNPKNSFQPHINRNPEKPLSSLMISIRRIINSTYKVIDFIPIFEFLHLYLGNNSQKTIIALIMKNPERFQKCKNGTHLYFKRVSFFSAFFFRIHLNLSY